jgi:hypothetical protein
MDVVSASLLRLSKRLMVIMQESPQPTQALDQRFQEDLPSLLELLVTKTGFS